jgi:hypothetical protein
METGVINSSILVFHYSGVHHIEKNNFSERLRIYTFYEICLFKNGPILTKFHLSSISSIVCMGPINNINQINPINVFYNTDIRSHRHVCL